MKTTNDCSDHRRRPSWHHIAAMLSALTLLMTGVSIGPVASAEATPAPTELDVAPDVVDLAIGREGIGIDGASASRLVNDETAMKNFEHTGYLLTDAELDEFRERNELGFQVAQLLPTVSELPGFTGAELVHHADGLFRVFVSDPASNRAIVRVFEEEGIERFEIVLVEHSEIDLINDIVLAWDTLDQLGLRNQVASISLQDDFGGIEIAVNSERSIEALEQSLTHSIRSTLEFTIETTPLETACSNRGNCTSPMRPGIRMERGSVNGADCTMGFHVRHGSNEQYLTAGHCSYGSESKFWYHDGYGYVGDRKQSAYGGSNSRDVMRVEMPDSQASDDIYITSSSTADIVGQFNTNQIYNGLPVCMSGEQSGLKCGSINDKWDTWTGGDCGCTQWGSDTNYSTVGGDSGAPVYHQQWWSGYSQRVAYAVGINNTSGGHFTRIQDALSRLSVTLVT